ncbi:MAG: hypothetical protein LC798_15380 [Chloroflexi bacterium]|nr:hypothetical protein [Chloroflexota bacterium]
MSTVAPDRSETQRLDALAEANRRRALRAEFKAGLKDVPRAVAMLGVRTMIGRPAPGFETMKVAALLLAIPRYGVVRVHKLLVRVNVSPSTTLAGLSDRARARLLNELGG